MPARLPFVLLLVGAKSAVPVEVEGQGACPSAAEVAARLRPLVAAGEQAGSPAVARIEETADGVRLVLTRPGAGVVAERRLARVPSCAAMAAAVALAIAAWQSDVRPEFPVTTAEVAAPKPDEPPLLLTARAPPEGAAAPAAFDVGLAAVIGRSHSWSPGLLARASFTPGQRGFGPSAFVGAEMSRTQAVGAGRLLWRRWEAALGVHHRWRGTLAVHDPHLELGAALLQLEGAGFEQNFRRTGVSPAAAAGWRLVLPLAGARWQLAPWADARAVVWPRREVALELPSMSRWVLPRFSLMLAVGIAAGRFR